MTDPNSPDVHEQYRKQQLGKQVTLTDLVAMCQDCVKVCRERTQRFVDDHSTPAKGYEDMYRKAAEEVRDKEIALCMQECELVKGACPAPSALARYDEFTYGGLQQGGSASAAGGAEAVQQPEKKRGWLGVFGGKGGSNKDGKASEASASRADTLAELPTRSELQRCERIVERWTSQLFRMANKPTKVVFSARDPKTGIEFSMGDKEKFEKQADEVMQRAQQQASLLHRAGTRTVAGEPAAHLDPQEDNGVRKTQRWALMLRNRQETLTDNQRQELNKQIREAQIEHEPENYAGKPLGDPADFAAAAPPGGDKGGTAPRW